MEWGMNKNPDIHTETSEGFFEESAVREVKTKLFNHMTTIVIASLSLISALAWEEALHDLYELYFHNSQTILGKFGYAVLVTLITVIISVIIGRGYIKRARNRFPVR